jgi:uncharacterized alpha-E superfamily protein
MISESTAFKIFYFGWHLAKFDTSIKKLQNYLNRPDSSCSPDELEWWLPLLEDLDMKKEYLFCYPVDFSRTRVLYFLTKDLNNPSSIISTLYSIREYSNGTLPLEVYNQTHRTIEDLKCIPDNELSESLPLILEDIARDIKSLIGTLALHTEYMHSNKN